MGRMDGADYGKYHSRKRERIRCAADNPWKFQAISGADSRCGGRKLLFRMEGVNQLRPQKHMANHADVRDRQPFRVFRRNHHAFMVRRIGRYQRH